MYARAVILFVGVVLSGFVLVAAPRTAIAIPAMSRQTGEPCSTCHDVIPKLNPTGQKFRANGLRFPGHTERDTTPNVTPVPRSEEKEIDAHLHQRRAASKLFLQNVITDLTGSVPISDLVEPGCCALSAAARASSIAITDFSLSEHRTRRHICTRLLPSVS